MRIISIKYTTDMDNALHLLNRSGIPYDFDSPDRLLLDDALPNRDDFANACRVLDQHEISYSVF